MEDYNSQDYIGERIAELKGSLATCDGRINYFSNLINKDQEKLEYCKKLKSDLNQMIVVLENVCKSLKKVEDSLALGAMIVNGRPYLTDKLGPKLDEVKEYKDDYNSNVSECEQIILDLTQSISNNTKELEIWQNKRKSAQLEYNQIYKISGRK